MLLAAWPLAAAAGDTCDDVGTVEAWAEPGPEARIAGLDAGIVSCTARYFAVKAGVSYYGYDGDVFQGVTGSVRLQAGTVLIPYVGAGLLAGLASLDESAADDGVDNDGDGNVDEPGEEIEIQDASAFLFPEVGLRFAPGRTFGLSITARRYYGREFTGEVIYGIGVTLRPGD